MNREETFDWKQAMRHFADGKVIQIRIGDNYNWSNPMDSSGNITFLRNCKYRLTPERKKIPLCKEDFKGKGIVWFKNKTTGFQGLMIGLNDCYVWLAHKEGASFSSLMEDWEYSFSTFDWFPCFKYEGEG